MTNRCHLEGFFMQIRRALHIALPTLALMIANPAAAEDAIYTPSGAWVVDYGDEQCRVGRQFVSGDQSLFLNFGRVESDDKFRFQVIGDLPFLRSQNGKVNVQFLPDGTVSDTVYYVGKRNDGQSVLITSSPLTPFRFHESPPEFFEARAGRARLKMEKRDTLNGLTITIKGQDPMVFQTGPMGQVLTVLEDCTDGLAEFWGFDGATEKSLTRRAEPENDIGNWIQPRDYPKLQLRDGQVAVVDFRLNIDANGAVSDCVTSNAVGDQKFSDTVCAVVKERAKFTPALDKDGQPVHSFYTNRVSFMF